MTRRSGFWTDWPLRGSRNIPRGFRYTWLRSNWTRAILSAPKLFSLNCRGTSVLHSRYGVFASTRLFIYVIMMKRAAWLLRRHRSLPLPFSEDNLHVAALTG